MQRVARTSITSSSIRKKCSTRSYMMKKQVVFDRRLKRIQRDRAALADPSIDFLKDEIADRLTDRLLDVKDRKFPNVLDMGAGRGHARKFLDDRGGIETLYQTDLSEDLLRYGIKYDDQYRLKPRRIVADEERLPFANNTFDAVLSNLDIHWVNDLPGCFEQISNILKPDGLFLASMFGEHTLQELRSAFLLAEREREGGVSPHISPFVGVSDIGNLLSGARFALPTIDRETITVKYKDAYVLMHELQLMGENNSLIHRRKYVSKETLMAAAAIYQKMYADEDGRVPATFDIIYIIGWTPHDSQPKPMKRGTATHSFKDLDDIPKDYDVTEAGPKPEPSKDEK